MIEGRSTGWQWERPVLSSLASLLLAMAIAATISATRLSGLYRRLCRPGRSYSGFPGLWLAERAVFSHPTSLAILTAILLVGGALPFVYRSPQDFLAPVLILPMLTTIALGALARPATWVPSPTAFALICLIGSLIALIGAAMSISYWASIDQAGAIIPSIMDAGGHVGVPGHGGSDLQQRAPGATSFFWGLSSGSVAP